MSTEMMTVARVDDWNIYRGASGQTWIKDLDLAERAHLAKPRDIRTTIKGLIDDGIINDIDGAGTTGATDVPLYHAERVMVPAGGLGRMQEVTEYYLNEEAALHVIMRLRTPSAVALQKAVVRVFMMVRRGEVPPLGASAELQLQDLRTAVAALAGLVQMLAARPRIAGRRPPIVPRPPRRQTNTLRVHPDETEAVRDFIAGVPASVQSIKSTVLYEMYCTWCAARGKNPVSHTKFSPVALLTGVFVRRRTDRCFLFERPMRH